MAKNQVNMATTRRKKTTTTPARRRATPARRASNRSPVRRRRRIRKKRGMLSEMFNEAAVMNTGKSIGSGAFGGGIVYMIDKLFYDSGNKGTLGERALVFGGSTFIMGAMFKQQNIASGMAGAATLRIIEQYERGMSESDMYLEQNYVDTQQLPSVLDTEGQPVMMEEDESVYLSEDDGLYLSEY